MRPPTEDVEDEVAEDENKIINEVRIHDVLTTGALLACLLKPYNRSIRLGVLED